MGLTKTQQTIWGKARAYGFGDQAVGLTDGICAYLVGRIVHDLGLRNKFPEVPEGLPPFFGMGDFSSLVIEGVAAWKHLDNLAGPTMSLFLDNYIRGPIDRLIAEAPQKLPEFVAKMTDNGIIISIGDEELRIVRRETTFAENQHNETPDNIEDNIPVKHV
jgi:hypothetical protein